MSCSFLPALLCTLAAIVWSPPSAAQSCQTNPGSIHQTFPASNSRDVPRNGLVVVSYCPTDGPIGDLVNLEDVRLLRDRGGGGEACDCVEAGAECLPVADENRCLMRVETTRVIAGFEVRLLSADQLAPRTVYVIEAPQPAGVSRLRFVTGDSSDNAPPLFDGITEVEIEGCGGGRPSAPACPPESQGDEGFLAVIQAEAGRDEVGRVNLEYRAFQVRDDELIERGRVRGDGTDNVTLSVYIPAEELNDNEWERLCFAMSALDPYGHEQLPDVTICEQTPEYSPFGSLCAAAPGRCSADLWPALLVWGILLWIRTRDRRR